MPKWLCYLIVAGMALVAFALEDAIPGVGGRALIVAMFFGLIAVMTGKTARTNDVDQTVCVLSSVLTIVALAVFVGSRFF